MFLTDVSGQSVCLIFKIPAVFFDSLTLKMGPISSPETSVKTTLRRVITQKTGECPFCCTCTLIGPFYLQGSLMYLFVLIGLFNMFCSTYVIV